MSPKPNIINLFSGHIFTVLLLNLFIARCAPPEHGLNAGEFIQLQNWEIRINEIWRPTKAVPWETSVHQGEPGHPDHDGFGEYRVSFYLPSNLSNKQTAFFTECLDDADRAFLNGTKIGETGKVPVSQQNGDASGFRSGVREPRLYYLPAELLNKNSANELRILVYDFSGTGGFCYPQEPVIGEYDVLWERYKKQVQANDLPRTAVIAIFFSIMIYLGNQLFSLKDKAHFSYLRERFVNSLNLLIFFGISGDRQNKKNAKYQVKAEFFFRFFLSFFVCINFLFFILSEVTYKYSFIESEPFWFKAPAITLTLGLLLLIIIYHSETFGPLAKGRPKNLSSKIFFCLAILTHPFLYFLFLLFLFFQPPSRAWSFFVVSGMLLMLLILFLFFVFTIFILFREGHTMKDKVYKDVLIKEGRVRLVFLLGLIVSIIIFKYSIQLFSSAALIMTVFFIIYMIFSINFFKKYEIRLPIIKDTFESIFEKLQITYNLTYTEAKLAGFVYSGLTREDICHKLDISYGTFKNHMKSIYAKTLELSGDNKNSPEHSHVGKFQRFTIFLYNLGG